MTWVFKSSGRWKQEEEAVRTDLTRAGMGLVGIWSKGQLPPRGAGNALEGETGAECGGAARSRAGVGGKQDRHRPFIFFCFHFTNVSDAGRVCDVFCQNSRRQSNRQNFTAVVYGIEVLIFPVSIPLPFDTSVYKLQGH